jgi:hypothetical protein
MILYSLLKQQNFINNKLYNWKECTIAMKRSEGDICEKCMERLLREEVTPCQIRVNCQSSFVHIAIVMSTDLNSTRGNIGGDDFKVLTLEHE